ncbi:hypothetical protein KBZ18_03750 [Synechococcus sp. Cruz-9H2]|uniref:hypothetical protein n=1 Tax=unclassified Synechococcus TaxID=2626047 RepID=UPI0020CDE666|nr:MULTISPECIES: hypothetical protein [unclassified Synechococcus]MCP9818607.1 hypothetical protein [Synechococcus sp. Cruz-9H2]MCP9842837.1 hypothetical protein [Synechococcus sp. Edmonson 11F2]MCP9855503.1 hypothetical protein [Synechococcus sp. Cruz-9C9]MCP9862251.1 hypothetical protein [Synechococcus sp. Cruz-7E5]MCP9869522.1 hypothetical protein [Synechococcus sp. Cruz-7B9]
MSCRSWPAGVVISLLCLSLPARASSDLNPDIEKMCQGLAVINTELGATAAPGTPMGKRMQNELSLSQAQYGALWSLMKLTPTSTCSSLY